MDQIFLGNRYELYEEIGSGGMAHVFKARDTLLDRIVAIKILKPEYIEDTQFIERFRVEAKAAASLSNSNIVMIYDVGQDDGIYYIIMEYVDGITLKEYIANVGRIPWKEAVTIAIQMTQAIASAHSNKIIHRDIKPQNVLITRDRKIKITDFGIARAASSTTITTVGNAMGSVHYFSPEQAKGALTDEKSDIYSLGITLYEMLTGSAPFDGETPIAVALKHIQEPPVDPSSLNPQIPRGLSAVILKSIEKDKFDRYQSMGEMLTDLTIIMKDPSGETLQYASLYRNDQEWVASGGGGGSGGGASGRRADTGRYSVNGAYNSNGSYNERGQYGEMAPYDGRDPYYDQDGYIQNGYDHGDDGTYPENGDDGEYIDDGYDDGAMLPGDEMGGNNRRSGRALMVQSRNGYIDAGGDGRARGASKNQLSRQNKQSGHIKQNRQNRQELRSNGSYGGGSGRNRGDNSYNAGSGRDRRGGRNDGGSSRRGGYSGFFIVIVLIAVLAAIGFIVWIMNNIFGVIQAPSPISQRDDTFSVGNYVGRYYIDVYDELRTAGIRTQENRISNDLIEEGIIVAQSKSEGLILHRNGADIIEFEVSNGPSRFTIPDYREYGSDSRAAEIDLEDKNLKVTVIDESNSTVPKGYVIRTEPGAGSQLSPGANITIFRSSGSDVSQTLIPQLIGKTFREAIDIIGEAKLTLGNTVPNTASNAAIVIRQSIAPNTVVDEGVSIDLWFEDAEPSPDGDETTTEEEPTPTPEETPEPTPTATPEETPDPNEPTASPEPGETTTTAQGEETTTATTTTTTSFDAEGEPIYMSINLHLLPDREYGDTIKVLVEATPSDTGRTTRLLNRSVMKDDFPKTVDFSIPAYGSIVITVFYDGEFIQTRTLNYDDYKN